MLFEIIAGVVFPPYATYRLLDWVLGKGAPKLDTRQALQKPTAEANCVLPVVWGTVDIKSPVLGFCGNFSKVGLRYKATAVFHLCHGIADNLLSISWDSKIAASAPFTQSVEYPGYNLQYQPDLFGADDGVQGRFLFYRGNRTDAVNSYVDSVDGELTQAYRGLATVVMEDNQLGNSPALHNPSFRVNRFWATASSSENPMGNPGTVPDFDDYLVISDAEYFVTYSDGWSFTTSGRDRIWRKTVSLTTVTNLMLGFAFYNSNPDSTNTGVKVYATPVGATERGPRIWPITNNPGSDNYHYFDFGVNEPADASELSIGNYTIEVVMVDLSGNPLTTILISGEMFAEGNIEVTGAAITKDVFFNSDYGSRIPRADLDASFLEASRKLVAEKFGMSAMWEGNQKKEDFVVDVLSHIDGRLVEDRVTGKLKLKLIRKIADPSNLFVIDRTNCISVTNPSKPELYESANCVTVNYYNLAKRSEDSVTVENQVLIEATGGRRIEINCDFRFVTRVDLAQRLALRELNAAGAMPFSCTLECDSSCMFLEQGDAFNFVWPDYFDGTLTMRVGEMDFGNGTTNRVIIQAVQDVFDLPALSLRGKA